VSADIKVHDPALERSSHEGAEQDLPFPRELHRVATRFTRICFQAQRIRMNARWMSPSSITLNPVSSARRAGA